MTKNHYDRDDPGVFHVVVAEINGGSYPSAH